MRWWHWSVFQVAASTDQVQAGWKCSAAGSIFIIHALTRQVDPTSIHAATCSAIESSGKCHPRREPKPIMVQKSPCQLNCVTVRMFCMSRIVHLLAHHRSIKPRSRDAAPAREPSTYGLHLQARCA
ncbi:hypothetical protein B0I35DRAFT_246239 [Stachybotrys elegans]|uniref:Secreted protein n=1 Tax=Stachybotrys elegans TaxID=80388 RepID=A0A8K0WQW5_9HYPO|nr:hypothetical protein B0I35DRAFT_246239 [Stachybotrys elegans]